MKMRFLYRAWKARWRDQRLEIAVARALIRPGDLVVDAGANKGAYLYWLRRCAGRTGTVIAYEPQPRLARYLQEICRAFAWNNVEVHGVALSNRVGKSVLHVPGSGTSPGASLEDSVAANTKATRVECLVDSLDHHLQGRHGLRFLKVDVEGHELALFEGAAETLRRDRPAVLFECEERHLTKHNTRDVFNFLQQFGYRGFLLTGDSLLPLAQFDPQVHQAPSGPQFWNNPNYFNNFLFLSGSLPSALNRYLTRPEDRG